MRPRRSGGRCRLNRGLWLVCCIGFVWAGRALALEWIWLTPNPSFSRDLAMGTSTIALGWAPQSQSINPAGFQLYRPDPSFRASVVVNPGAVWQLDNYRRNEARSGIAAVGDAVRLMIGAASVQKGILTAGILLSQPVMDVGDTSRYRNFEHHTPLELHQNSLVATLAVHPRVAVGGRIDRYYRFDVLDGEAYSYGVILRPRGVDIGVQYQRFPDSGAKVWHPFDRRADQCTSAGIAVRREDFSVTAQVMNLTQSGSPAFLEPHAGFEWRPVRALALRAGGMQFSGGAKWAWTAGLGLLDANWLHPRHRRLVAADDVLQLAVGMIYDHRAPQLGIGSLTCAWRF